MKAQDVRDIVFAHAIDTAAPNEALPSAARTSSITQEALHAIGKPQLQGSAGHKAFLQFLQLRAARIIQASQLPADVRLLQKHAPGVARWVPLAILLGALVLGFGSHRITDPHRVDVLSLSLIGIVLWNVLVYVALLAQCVLKLLRPKRQPTVPLLPTSGPAGKRCQGWAPAAVGAMAASGSSSAGRRGAVGRGAGSWSGAACGGALAWPLAMSRTRAEKLAMPQRRSKSAA